MGESIKYIQKCIIYIDSCSVQEALCACRRLTHFLSFTISISIGSTLIYITNDSKLDSSQILRL